MTNSPGIDPGLDIYWAAVDEVTNARDAAFTAAISEYEAGIAKARRDYLAYQDQRNELRKSVRNGSGQRGGQ